MENFRTYKIVTDRLVIRCYAPNDVSAMSAGIQKSQQHLAEFMPWAVKENHDLETVAARIRKFRGMYDMGTDYMMGIFEKHSGAYMGGTGLHLRVGGHAAEIGYWVHVDHINKGIATEAAAALTKVGFDIENLERIQIHMQVDNTISRRVPEKLGFVQEGTLRKRQTNTLGDMVDIHVYSMLREEYRTNPIFAQMEVKAFDFMDRPLPFVR